MREMHSRVLSKFAKAYRYAMIAVLCCVGLGLPQHAEAADPLRPNDIMTLLVNGTCYVLRIDPITGNMEQISLDLINCDQYRLWILDANRVLVTTYSATQDYTKIVDVPTGAISDLDLGLLGFYAEFARFPNGDLAILNGGLHRFDFDTQQTTLVSSADLLNQSFSPVPGPDGMMYLSVNGSATISGGVLRVDPQTGAHELISQDGLIDAPGRIEVSRIDNTKLIMLQGGGISANPLIEIDMSTGAQRALAPPLNPTFPFWFGASLARDNDVILVANSLSVQRVDSDTQLFSLLSDMYLFPVDVQVYRGECGDLIDNDEDGLVDLLDPGCASRDDPSELSACSDGIDNDADGDTDFPADADCAGASSDGELPACGDGIDNDSDGLIDLDDPGCRSAEDFSEYPECSDGVDNDNDGQTDMADPQCTTANDRGEQPACSDAIDNDDDNLYDLNDPDCLDPNDDTELPACDDGIDNDNDGHIDLADIGCRDLLDDTEQHACSDGIDNDLDDVFDFPADPDCTSLFDDSELVNCYDGVDNDGDGLTDFDDPHCDDLTDGGETAECQDGLDNDGDGVADWPLDPGCESLDDPSEKPQCSDQIDNDGDGDIDAADAHCTNPTDETELAECEDGIDNDGDGGIDFGDPAEGGDRHCAFPTDDKEKRCGLGFELALLLPAIAALARRRCRRWYSHPIAALALLLVVPTAWADTSTSGGGASGEGASAFAGLSQAPEANLYTGAMTMSVPIMIPPGRASATPELSLAYSSSAGPSAFGHGWSLSLGSIERNTKQGVLVCDNSSSQWEFDDDFILSLGGGTLELVADPVDPDLYRTRIDEAYLEARADKVNNEWEVVDRSGIIYRFGTHVDARLATSSPDFFYQPGIDWYACKYTTFWGLTQIEDPNGNTIDVSYERDLFNNATYIKQIEYGANPDASLEEHPFRVTFRTASRQYKWTSGRRGTRETMDKLIDQIQVLYKPDAQAASYQVVRTYELEYEELAEGGLTLLNEVRDAEGLLPVQTFEYAKDQAGFTHTLSYTPPSLPGGNDFLRKSQFIAHDTWGESVVRRSVMDMNGDGFKDLIVADNGVAWSWHVYLGGENGFSTTPITWSISSLPGNYNYLGRTRTEPFSQIWELKWDTFDITGDGIPDWVDASEGAGWGEWDVYPGSCSSASSCGFGAKQDWVAPTEMHLGATSNTLVDVNGDARPDTHSFGSNPWLNRGDELVSVHSTWLGGDFDFNGDGLTDRVFGHGGKVCIGADAEPREIAHHQECESDEGIASIMKVWLRTGRGTSEELRLYVPKDLFSRRETDESGDVTDTLVDFFDVNGDGLPDRVYWNATEGWGPEDGWAVQLNTGTGLELPVYSPGAHYDLAPPRVLAGITGPIQHQDGDKSEIEVFDWNGDGFVDRVDARSVPWTIHLGGPPTGEPQRAGLLSKAHNGLGGVTEVRYATASRFDNSGLDGVPDMPMNPWVTTAIRRSDGLCDPPQGVDRFDPTENPCIGAGHETLLELEYAGGMFDAEQREFRGFRTVWEHRAAGDPVSGVRFNTHKVTFHQDDLLRGKIEKDELYAGDDITGTLVRRQSSTWELQCPGDPSDPGDTVAGACADPISERTQLYLAEHKSEEFSFIGDSSLDRCILNWNQPPDDWGRVTRTCSLSCDGAPATPGDCSAPVVGQLDTVTVWADPIGDKFVRERPASIQTLYYKDVGGAPVQHFLAWKWFHYDSSTNYGLPNGQVYWGRLKRVLSFLDQSHAGPQWPEVRQEYDDFGNVIEFTDPRGNVFESDYDANYFSLYPVAERSPDTAGVVHEVEKVTDLRFGKPTQVTGENGEVTEVTYDGLGRVTCQAKPGHGCGGGETPSLEYDYVYATPGAGLEARHSYVETRRYEPGAPSGQTVARKYSDALGRVRFATEQRVVGTVPTLRTIVTGQVEYDAAGRARVAYAPYMGDFASPPPNAATEGTEYDYRLNGGVEFDPLGRVHVLTPPDGNSMTTWYEGLRTRVANALGDETVRLEDDFGYEIRKELYDATSLEMWFDYAYDGIGKLLTTTVSGNTNTTVTNTYDSLGRLITTDDPDSGTWKYGYDRAGNLVYQDDPHVGQHVQWIYDEVGRLEYVCLFGASDGYAALGTDCGTASEQAHYAYDSTASGNRGIGRVTHVTDPTGSESFRYDERGRVTERTKTIHGKAATMHFAFDATDRVTSIEYPDGETLFHSYGAGGQLTRLHTPKRVYLDGTEYDRFGRPERIVHGNGVEDLRNHYDYSESFRLQGLRTHNPGSGQVSFDLDYTYTDTGKIHRIIDQRDPSGNLSNDSTYTYDGLGRLTQVDWNAGSTYDQSFSYNALGNMTHKAGATILYDPAHPHQATHYNGLTIQYDANGRRTSKNNGAQSYGYDLLNRLTSIEVSGDTVTYDYDYAGRRVSKRVNGGERFRYFSGFAESRSGKLYKYYYAGDLRIASMDKSAPQFSGLHGGGASGPPPWFLSPLCFSLIGGLAVLLLVGAGRRDVRIGIAVSASRASGAVLLVLLTSIPVMTTGCGDKVVYHYHVDHQGSVQAVTNANGSLIRQIRYEVYGEIRGRFSGGGGLELPAHEKFRHEFTGYETEIESGLQYAGSRFYDPELGQFLTLDPARELASPFAYAAYDPLNFVDPTGEDLLSFLVGAFIIGAIAATVSFSITLARTGDFKAALRSGALSFGVAFAAFIIPPLAGAAIAPKAAVIAELAVDTAMVGFATKSTVDAIRNDDPIGALIGGVSLVLSAHGLAKTVKGVPARLAASGQPIKLDFGVNNEGFSVSTGDQPVTYDLGNGVTAIIPPNTDVAFAPLTQGAAAGSVAIGSTNPITITAYGIPLVQGSLFVFGPENTLLVSDVVPASAPFNVFQAPTHAVVSRILGTRAGPALNNIRNVHANFMTAQKAISDAAAKANQSVSNFMKAADRFLKALQGN